MVEPLPGGAIGLIGVTLVAVLAPYVLFSPAELAKPGFKPVGDALKWALSGFSNGTVWLIFGAFMFALGYEKTGLGRRIALLLVRAMGRRTLTLGYAVTIADTILAPFTPSNTARSGGTIYPVIRNLPAALRLEAQRPVRAAHRLLPDVGGDRGHLRDELDVPDGACAKPPGARAGQEDRGRRDQLGAVVPGIRAGRASCCWSSSRSSPTGSTRPR